jgi:hypothetical protein
LLLKFQPLWLIVDVILAAIILVMVVAAWEIRRRRGRLLAFSLCDMLALVTVVCVALGWVTHERIAYDREQRQMARIKYDYKSALDTWTAACAPPAWMRSLCGDEYLPRFTWRIVRGSVDPHQVRSEEALRAETSAFPHLSVIRLRVWSAYDEHFRLSMLRAIPRLDTLEMDFDNFKALDDQDIRDLSQLPNLKNIIVTAIYDEPDPDLVARLKTALPNCALNGDDDW